MFSDDMQEIVESFIVETREIFEELNQDLILLEQNSHDKELINKIFRAVHTVKGTSIFLDFQQMSDVAHHFEDVLNKLRRDQLKFNTAMLDVLFDAFDLMKALLQQVIDQDIQEIDLKDIIARLNAIANESDNAVETEQTNHPQSDLPASEDLIAMLDPNDFDETENLETEAAATTSNDTHPMFSPEMQEIVESFVVETTEIFDALDQDLLLLEHNADDQELVNRIFRAVHTIKGTAGFLAFEEMGEITHHFEDVLNKLRRDQLKFEPWMLDVMFEAFDVMKCLLQQVIDRRLEPIGLEKIIAKLDAISNGEKVLGKNEPVKPTKEVETQSLPKTEPSNAPVAQKATPRRIEKSVDTTIRVDVRRLDDLMNLVGELVLGRNRLSQIVGSELSEQLHSDFLGQLQETTAQIDFITTELQAAVMKTRMVQVGRVFNRFPRVVRDISKEFAKEIDLIIEGEDTEMDKSIIEEISDPLIHLVRNAADHGIETPEERVKNGKPRRGTIRLMAGHEGNHIVIVIEDDGKGINPEIIKAKAVEKGIITAQEAEDMTDKDSYNLIFAPGFSTAQKLTSVSGRGVGMDVVKTNVTKLNGMIFVDSEVGKGSRFVLKLPLTLAIIQGLLVNVGSETYAVPLTSVLEVVRNSTEDLAYIHGREVIRLRDRILPLIYVDELLGINDSKWQKTDRFYTVVIGVANTFFGLVVDSLLGQKEVVIKSLGNFLKKSPGIAGSTILGDGRVIMILDVGEIAALMKSKILSEA
jgi:two-component system chemotaxis sensor kinase CheA